eukprot:6181884-Pleurochrysis_carterae.AAC.1
MHRNSLLSKASNQIALSGEHSGKGTKIYSSHPVSAKASGIPAACKSHISTYQMCAVPSVCRASYPSPRTRNRLLLGCSPVHSSWKAPTFAELRALRPDSLSLSSDRPSFSPQLQSWAGGFPALVASRLSSIMKRT